MKATFAAGCFWHVEEAFRQVPGVKSTHVGYTGGTMKKPSYEEVCTGRTGHAEAVEIDFDPKKVSYKQLLAIFWQSHDPTQRNRQGPDIGTQYRSAIFYHSEQQRKEAEMSLHEEQKKYKKAVVTEIIHAGQFYRAEEYHQRYLQKRGLRVCPV